MSETAPTRKSDLGVRTLSAIVMLAVAAAALWLGGVWLDGFIIIVAVACFAEFARLVLKAASGAPARLAGILAGAAYIGLAARILLGFDTGELLLVLGIVVATDIGAFFAGRTFGGPRIAPRISPSKTWAGLLGGMAPSAVWAAGAIHVLASLANSANPASHVLPFAIGGAMLAIVAQAGDFFESWLKRRAGVKDSSNLIPGHGGVFDRVDGLLAVALVAGLIMTFAP